jgi:hypothetical protein
MLAADPSLHQRWAGNAVNLAIAGAVWVVADAIAAVAGARDGGIRAAKRPGAVRETSRKTVTAS